MTTLELGLALLGFAVVLGLLGWLLGRRPARPGAEGIADGVALRWTRHVRERMEQRGVTEEVVEATLRSPQTRTFDPQENSWKFERTFSSEHVKVWVSAEPWPPVDEVVVKSTAAQRFADVSVPRGQVGKVIGRGGSTVTRIRRETGAQIDVGQDGRVRITADTWEQVARARTLVRAAARG